MVEHMGRLEHMFQLRVWYARVHTKSNRADAPSRLQLEGLERILCKQVEWDVSCTVLCPAGAFYWQCGHM